MAAVSMRASPPDGWGDGTFSSSILAQTDDRRRERTRRFAYLPKRIEFPSPSPPSRSHPSCPARPPGIQFYRRHHDSSDHKNDSTAGHRILTFFLYLNDVEEGGETRFTTLGIDVKPKKVGGTGSVYPHILCPFFFARWRFRFRRRRRRCPPTTPRADAIIVHNFVPPRGEPAKNRPRSFFSPRDSSLPR